MKMEGLFWAFSLPPVRLTAFDLGQTFCLVARNDEVQMKKPVTRPVQYIVT